MRKFRQKYIKCVENVLFSEKKNRLLIGGHRLLSMAVTSCLSNYFNFTPCAEYIN